MRENIKRTRSEATKLTNNQLTGRRVETVPVAVEDGVLEESDGGFYT